MCKYIDADRLEKDGWSMQRTYKSSATEMVCEMKNPTDFPAADVAEMRRGRWVRGDKMADYPRIPYKAWETYCSCCGEIKEQTHNNFCGNCGAKMDGDAE